MITLDMSKTKVEDGDLAIILEDRIGRMGITAEARELVRRSVFKVDMAKSKSVLQDLRVYLRPLEHTTPVYGEYYTENVILVKDMTEQEQMERLGKVYNTKEALMETLPSLDTFC